jgi:hypothetical protein
MRSLWALSGYLPYRILGVQMRSRSEELEVLSWNFCVSKECWAGSEAVKRIRL